MPRITKKEKEQLEWYDTRIHTISKFFGPQVDAHGFDPGFLFHIVSPNFGTIDLDKNLGDDLYNVLINLKNFFEQFKLVKQNIKSRFACPFCWQYTQANILASKDEGCVDNCPWQKLEKLYDLVIKDDRIGEVKTHEFNT